MKPVPALGTALALALALLPGAALAHPGHDGMPSLAAGFAHPLNGLDHMLAMVAVGTVAALRGGRATCALPLAFLGTMSLGALLGMAGVPLPFAEAGITASILVFGLLALIGRGLPVAMLAGVTGLFAVFHGYAHGAEMPEAASGLRYGLGFLAGTALLHAAGLGLGALAALMRPHGPAAKRLRAAPDA